MRLRYTVEITLDPGIDSLDLTEGELALVRGALERHAQVFGIPLRPRGRGKGHEVYLMTNDVTVTLEKVSI